MSQTHKPLDGEQVGDPLQSLLADFLSKIEAEWPNKFAEKHGSIFEGVSKLPSKSAFYSDLADDINKTYKAKFGMGAASLKEIKIHTVRRIMEEGASRSYDEKTCDLLSAYVGYANWAAYQLRDKLKLPDTTTKAKRPKVKLVIIGLIAAILLVIGGVYWKEPTQILMKKKYLEVISSTSKTAPGKVTVYYDLTGLDFRRTYILCDGMRIVPQQEEGDYTFSMAQPQLGTIKLFLNEKLLDEVSILMESKGWQGYVNLLVPLEKRMFYTNGTLQLGAQYASLTRGKEYYPAFLNFREFGVSADNMFFETRVLNNAAVGGQWAYDISIDLVGRKKRAYFNILAPDAILYSRIGVSDTELSGTLNPDLKALCLTMDDWRTIGMRVKNKKAWIVIDGKDVLQVPYEKDLGDLVGIQLYIKGAGAVDWVRVTDLDSDKVKYFDDFVSEEAEVQ